MSSLCGAVLIVSVFSQRSHQFPSWQVPALTVVVFVILAEKSDSVAKS